MLFLKIVTTASMKRIIYVILGCILVFLIVIGTWITVEFLSQKQPFVVFFFKWMAKVTTFLLIEMQILLVAAQSLMKKNFVNAVIKTSATRLAYASTFLFPSARVKILSKKKQAVDYCTKCFDTSKSKWSEASLIAKTSVIVGLTIFLAMLGVSILLLPFAIIWEFLKKKLGQTGVEKAWDKFVNTLYRKAPWFKRMMYPFRLIKVYAIITGRRIRTKKSQESEE